MDSQMRNLSVDDQPDFPIAEEPQFDTKQTPPPQEVKEDNKGGASFIGEA